jgi:hypothetical protein
MERRQLAEVFGQQVVHGDSVLGSVPAHLVGNRHDRLVEVGVRLSQPELLFQEVRTRVTSSLSLNDTSD